MPSSKALEHTEPKQVPFGGRASDGSLMVLRVEAAGRTLVVWHETPQGDPDYVLDAEINSGSIWTYRRVGGFGTPRDVLDGMRGELDSLV